VHRQYFSRQERSELVDVPAETIIITSRLYDLEPMDTIEPLRKTPLHPNSRRRQAVPVPFGPRQLLSNSHLFLLPRNGCDSHPFYLRFCPIGLDPKPFRDGASMLHLRNSVKFASRVLGKSARTPYTDIHRSVRNIDCRAEGGREFYRDPCLKCEEPGYLG